MGHGGECLTCCLCGKPANYKDLGDLCGPYYTEDGVPRKILTITHTEAFREELDKTNDDNSGSSEEPGNSSKSDTEGTPETEGNTEATAQEGSVSSSSSRHHWRFRRAERMERPGREGGLRRLTLRERFKRMKQLQAVNTGAPTGQVGNESLFQRLQMEAEAKEHWAHENCAIWTKGIIMVAGRLYGLKEAANTSSCYKCQIVGASLSCCWRGCSHKYHYVCAKEIGKRPQREREGATGG
uniref:PHD-type domain-containing protein n=1 Tax=Neolamprologus brichardi TaxID=32507 RepID=A0A3Q4G974_NEOBR